MDFLRELYNQFQDKWYYRMYINDSYKYDKLTVNLDRDEIEKVNARDGTIPLRKYNGETKLILGCGNLKPYHKVKNDTDDSEDFEWWTNYCKDHRHPNAVTVDVDIHRNPTVIGRFGYNSFSHFPNQSFESIIFEGFMLEANEEKAFLAIPELIRMLKPNGVVIKCNSEEKETVFRKENNHLVKISDPSIILTDNSEPIDLTKHMWPDSWEEWQAYIASKM